MFRRRRQKTPRERREEGSQTCNVWNTRQTNCRAEGAARFLAHLQCADAMVNRTRRFTSGYFLTAPPAQKKEFSSSS
ncbi:MAG: hypothetical protein H7Y30_12010 [Pyrinomonadaceae bacterium]|nr:hypothetical protein [Pyrinomonadaceae bacterium]